MIRAAVVKVYGDPNMSNPMKDAISTEDTALRHELEVVKKELADLRAKEAQYGVSAFRQSEQWKEAIAELDELTAPSEALTGLKGKLLIGYGMICYAIDTIYKRLAAINREP